MVAGVEIEFRSGVLEAVDRGWDHLADPGTWWSGAQRVGLAEQFRAAADCELCRERAAALTPYAVDGDHDAVDDLPAAAVDAVHRLATDPGRLSTRWHREWGEAGRSDGELVDLISVGATVAVADTFDRGRGAPRRPLPGPRSGEPARTTPEGARVQTARVPTVEPADATGEVAAFYGDAPMVPNIVKALTLCPAEANAWYRMAGKLYGLGMAPMPDDWTLSRAQVELVAATVSNHNECFY